MASKSGEVLGLNPDDEGKILWKFDSGNPVQTLNGEKVAGSLIYHGGQTVADGTLFLNSGIPWVYTTSVLLAFTVNGN